MIPPKRSSRSAVPASKRGPAYAPKARVPALGDFISIFWSSEKKNFRGKLTARAPTLRGPHCFLVQYEDGDVQEHNLDAERWDFDTPHAPNATRGKARANKKNASAPKARGKGARVSNRATEAARPFLHTFVYTEPGTPVSGFDELYIKPTASQLRRAGIIKPRRGNAAQRKRISPKGGPSPAIAVKDVVMTEGRQKRARRRGASLKEASQARGSLMRPTVAIREAGEKDTGKGRLTRVDESDAKLATKLPNAPVRNTSSARSTTQSPVTSGNGGSSKVSAPSKLKNDVPTMQDVAPTACKPGVPKRISRKRGPSPAIAIKDVVMTEGRQKRARRRGASLKKASTSRGSPMRPIVAMREAGEKETEKGRLTRVNESDAKLAAKSPNGPARNASDAASATQSPVTSVNGGSSKVSAPAKPKNDVPMMQDVAPTAYKPGVLPGPSVREISVDGANDKDIESGVEGPKSGKNIPYCAMTFQRTDKTFPVKQRFKRCLKRGCVRFKSTAKRVLASAFPTITGVNAIIQKKNSARMVEASTPKRPRRSYGCQLRECEEVAVLNFARKTNIAASRRRSQRAQAAAVVEGGTSKPENIATDADRGQARVTAPRQEAVRVEEVLVAGGGPGGFTPVEEAMERKLGG